MVIRAVVYNSYGARLFMAQIAMHQWIGQREEKRTEFNCMQQEKENSDFKPGQVELA